MRFIHNFRNRQNHLAHIRKITKSEQDLLDLRLDELRRTEEIKSAYQFAEDQILASNNLEELSLVKTIQLADETLSAIMQKGGKSALKSKLSCKHTCLFCSKSIIYAPKIAGTTAKCPNKNCGRQIQLPNKDFE